MWAINTVLLLGALGLAASPLQADGDGNLERCLSIQDDAERLACFDAYALQVRRQESAESRAGDVHDESAQSSSKNNPQDNFHF